MGATMIKPEETEFQVIHNSAQGGPFVIAGMMERAAVTMSNPNFVEASIPTIDKAKDVFKDIEGAVVISTHFDGPNVVTFLYSYEGALVSVDSDSNDIVRIKVLVDADDSGESAAKIAVLMAKRLTPVPVPDSGTAKIKFWYHTHTGVQASTRSIVIPAWDSISNNYSAQASKQLSDLMNFTPQDINGGKIILMHGPAGSGKTTAIRSLVNSWRDWCDGEYVIDPENAFGEGSYLVTLLLNDTMGDSGRWRLVIMEDAEEFLTPNAKKDVGQSLSRLLNFGDGLIGQGLKVLVLMTTNVPVTQLHPAITRPGRCLANIEVPKLSASESTSWLGSQHEEATLAELFEVKEKAQIGKGIQAISAGQYL
jgi:hypothetical protein